MSNKIGATINNQNASKKGYAKLMQVRVTNKSIFNIILKATNSQERGELLLKGLIETGIEHNEIIGWGMSNPNDNLFNASHDGTIHGSYDNPLGTPDYMIHLTHKDNKPFIEIYNDYWQTVNGSCRDTYYLCDGVLLMTQERPHENTYIHLLD